jgi:hypothetical protein
MARDKLDNKLAGGMSPEMQKGLRTVAKIHDMLGDLRKRCDDVRKQMEEIEREDLVAQQRVLAQQRFFQGAPLNGAYHHGLEAFDKLTKKG